MAEEIVKEDGLIGYLQKKIAKDKKEDDLIGYLQKKIAKDKREGKPVPGNLESFFFATYAKVSIEERGKEVSFFLGPVRPLEGGNLRQRLDYGEEIIKTLNPDHVFLLYSHRTNPATKSARVASAPPESYFDLLLAGEAARRHKREVQILKKRLAPKDSTPTVQLVPYALIGRRCRQLVDKMTAKTLFLAHDGCCGEALCSVLAMCGATVTWNTFPLFAPGRHAKAVAFFDELFVSLQVKSDHALLRYTAEKVLADLLDNKQIPAAIAAALTKYPFNDVIRQIIKENPGQYRIKIEEKLENEDESRAIFWLMTTQPFLVAGNDRSSEIINFITEKWRCYDITPRMKFYCCYRLLDISPTDHADKVYQFITGSWDLCRQEIRNVHSSCDEHILTMTRKRLTDPQIPTEKKFIYLFQLLAHQDPAVVRRELGGIALFDKSFASHRKELNNKDSYFAKAFAWVSERIETESNPEDGCCSKDTCGAVSQAGEDETT